MNDNNKEKSDKAAKELREKLFYTKKNGYEGLGADEVVALSQYAEGYKKALDSGKTEREFAEISVRLARVAGFSEYSASAPLKAGDRIYRINRGRAVVLAVIGKNGGAGAQITAAHIDSPRIDLKPNPLYEDGELAMFKTHYYGGIRKYQWVAIPLELRGVLAKPDGETQKIEIGGGEDEPVFTITDLLPHLAKDQSIKPLSAAYTGENLNPLVASVPYADEGNDRVRLTAMSILNESYGMTERDFLTAELMLVPAGKARDVGLDRSMVGAYGQDDRVCAYTALTALLDTEGIPEKNLVCMLADKEEIGSDGVSGMQSAFFDAFMKDICENLGGSLRTCYAGSLCLSADVSVAFDPNFPEVSEKKNNAILNGGIVIYKYSGAAGKSGTSDATAETTAKVAGILDRAGVLWQTGELGKVDQGGGGTVAKYMANRNIDTIDAGVAVLSMHSPFEVTSKLDIYMTYKAFAAFYKAE